MMNESNTLNGLQVKFIPAKLFSSLNNEQRLALKTNYLNYLKQGNTVLHYIQAEDTLTFKTNLIFIIKKWQNDPFVKYITIFVKDSVYPRVEQYNPKQNNLF